MIVEETKAETLPDRIPCCVGNKRDPIYVRKSYALMEGNWKCDYCGKYVRTSNLLRRGKILIEFLLDRLDNKRLKQAKKEKLNRQRAAETMKRIRKQPLP